MGPSIRIGANWLLMPLGGVTNVGWGIAGLRGWWLRAGAAIPLRPPSRMAPPSDARLNPSILAYAMGPAALATLLFLRRFGVVAHVPVWLWLVVFAAIPAGSIGLEALCRRNPTTLWLNARVAWHAAAVTAVIYLSGWGPVLTAAFAFVALENVSHDGSRTWRRTALWSLLGIAVGQVAIWQRWAPSFLSVGKSEALGLMGAFVLLFVIRMAGATIEQKEDAETSMRVERGAVPLPRPELHRHHLRDGRRRLASSTPARPRSRCSAVSPRTSSGCGPPSSCIPRTGRASRPSSPRWSTTVAVTEPIQFRVEHTDGTYRYAEAVVSNLRDNPSVAGYVGNLRDITERKEAESQLLHVALHDPLTGLPNRTLILDRADQMLVRSRREYRPVAALFVDLDNFKDINDSLGHDAGDKVLQAVAHRFVGILRESDTVGRLGRRRVRRPRRGGLAGRRARDGRRAAPRRPARAVPHRGLRRRCRCTVTASIGIAGGQRNSASELLRDADIALYRAKALGKNRSALFQPEMQTAVLDRIELEADLRSALAEEQFFLLYQPVFDLDHVSVSGVEALLRWQPPGPRCGRRPTSSSPCSRTPG